MLAFLIASAAAVAQEQPELIDLADAEVAATHVSQDSPAANMIDGDEATFWAGEGHDLTRLPTNIILTLVEPVAVGRLEVVTQVFKQRLRLTDLEVYARVGDGWALLGAATGNEEVTFSIKLKPAEVSQLRLRVLNTARPDRAWPRVNEVHLFPPDGDAVVLAREPASVPDESYGERVFLEQALGIRRVVERAEFDPDKGYLFYARSCVDTLIEKGTDRYGDTRSPMLISILDCETHEHPNAELPPIEGQRRGDRALFGGNLQHDVMLLSACGYLSDLTGGRKYGAAAREYLAAFMQHCTNTPTGLWPWGEHAHWNFYKEAPGHNTHEYLGAPPLEFWELAWGIDADAVLREADGLLNHVVNLKTFDYNRHADITKVLTDPRPEGMGFLDFPRHGGFYIQVWAFAYSKTKDGKYLDWCERMMDHHVAVRNADSGLIPSTSTRDANTCNVMTQLSLAVSMLESVPLLDDTPTARRCESLAKEYLEALAALPHRPEERLFVPDCPVSGPKNEEEANLVEPAFTAHYGGTFLATDALLWTQAYRLTGDDRYLELAEAIAGFYAEAEAIPEAEHTRAHIYGSLIDLMLDMHELVGGEEWLAAAERYARQGVEDLYGNGLFRGATNLWYYESELWVSTLVYALVRLHAVATETPVKVKPSYFHR